MKKILLFLLTCIVYSNLMAQSPTLEWEEQIGSSEADMARSIAIDAYGHIYITGYFRGTVDFDPGTGVYNLTSAGYNDVFIQKLDADRNLIWAKRMGGTSTENGISIALDINGNIYTAGQFSGPVDFDPGAGVKNVVPTGALDIFIQKLDPNGDFLWVKHMGGPVSGGILTTLRDLTVDFAGNVYTTGFFGFTVDFDPGTGVSNLTSAQRDIFIQKLDTDGNFIWIKQNGGPLYEEGISIDVDDIGNVYTTGYFTDVVDFDPGPAINNFASAGSNDIYIQKLDPNGNLLWVKTMGSDGQDNGSDIKVDADNNIYVSSSFNNTVDFNPGNSGSMLTSAGMSDICIQKFDADGNQLWIKQIGGSDIEGLSYLTIDASKNLYLTGTFYGTADFDPGSSSYNLTSAGTYDIFIEKLDINGDLIWAERFGEYLRDDSWGIVVDVDRNVYVAGGYMTYDNVSSPNQEDIFVVKISQCVPNNINVSTGITGNTIEAIESGLAYKWLDCNNQYTVIDGESAQYFTASNIGSYAVEVEKNGCVDTSACVDITVLNTSTNVVGAEIKAYPNPSSGSFTLDIDSFNGSTITIYNTQGIIVRTIENVKGSLDLELEPGMYIIRIQSEKSMKKIKVVIE